jgi:large subunit ribosomal protein L21
VFGTGAVVCAPGTGASCESPSAPDAPPMFRSRASAMYAIVKTGGKQYKVAVDDVVTVEKLDGEPGAEIILPAVLLVDGDQVTTDASGLTSAVTATVVEHTKGPKIRIHKFKNKTGYHKRQGHRQPLTKVQVTAIGK